MKAVGGIVEVKTRLKRQPLEPGPNDLPEDLDFRGSAFEARRTLETDGDLRAPGQVFPETETAAVR